VPKILALLMSVVKKATTSIREGVLYRVWLYMNVERWALTSSILITTKQPAVHHGPLHDLLPEGLF